MKQWSYLNSAVQILQAYNGQEPFASFCKKHFSQHKKYGSKDRKQISHLCYCYFRLGKAAMVLPAKERIMAGLFLCSYEPNEMLAVLKPEWNEKTELIRDEKYSMLNAPRLNGAVGQEFSMLNVFPWKDELSEGIDNEKFIGSFFIQPDLFLRLRPGKENIVKQKLQQAGIEFKIISDDCIAMSNATKLGKVIELNKEAVVQDYNSQKVGELLIDGQTETVRQGVPYRVWDCCAGSGGKSIMTIDILGDIDLTISDIRKSILINLKQRFKESGIDNYNSYVIDLTEKSCKALPLESGKGFNLILCDAPCTGSGTWSRTPEQLYFFDKNEIDRYASLQKQIVSNTIPCLQPGGYFLYITCSVFKKENEEVVGFIQDNFDLQLQKMDLLKGYDKKADSMFAALFKKPL